MFGKYGDVDTAVATIRMSNGVMAVLTVARHNPLGYDIRTEIFGSRDSVSVGMGPQMPLRSLEPGVAPGAGPAWAFFQDRFREAYRNELAAFVQVARGEAPSQCTGEEAIEALRASIAATRALREHRPVSVAEVM
jgi:myo-inositol 2-dehydrogenase/D-chiro-inositol 1-dehydrogenase